MSKAAKSVFVWGIYVVVTGLGLIFMPNMILSTVCLPPTNEVWIRALGAIVLILGFYYFVAVKGDFVPLFKASIYARFFFVVACVVFVVSEIVNQNFLLFSILDALGAIWTLIALRQDKRSMAESGRV